MNTNYTIPLSLQFAKITRAIHKSTKAMQKQWKAVTGRNKAYLRKIRKVSRKRKKNLLKFHSREMYHKRRLRGDFCKSRYKHSYWLYNRSELFDFHSVLIRQRILNNKCKKIFR